MTRAVLLSIAASCLLYIVIGLALFCLQRTLIFANDKTDLQPGQVGLPAAEVLHLQTQDNVRLVAWLLRCTSDKLFIYFHGNGASLAARVERIKQLANFGFSVLAIDYRGFGGSEGKPSESGLMQDADATYEFGRALGYPAKNIILYGESLGSSLALSLASRRDVAGVILDSAFSSMADIATERYWMFPFPWLIRHPFHSDQTIGHVAAPILMLHGINDAVVPIRSARTLLAHAPKDTTFVAVENAGHIVFEKPQAQAVVTRWLSDLFAELTATYGRTHQPLVRPLNYSRQ